MHFVAFLFLSLIYADTNQLKEKSNNADKEIHFIEKNKFDETLKERLALVFYGAKWCTICQEFNPKWYKYPFINYKQTKIGWQYKNV